VTVGEGRQYHQLTMKQALSIAILVALASLVGVHAQETEGVLKPRTEIRGAVSSLVKELQRREAEVVKALAAQEALEVQVEALSAELAEVKGKPPSGATATRTLAVEAAANTQIAELRKQVSDLGSERDAAVVQCDKAEAVAVQLRGQIESERSERTVELASRERELAALIEANQKDRVTLSYNLGCLYKASKRYQKAEAEFLKALALQPEDPAIHYNLGVLYDDCLAQKNRAQKHYNRFLELAPDDDDAPRVVEWLSQIQ
jgi:tetratricopeptide (TPR) repeat protein